jgi:AbrB family looped-hinge helix DNA binding protein
MDSTLTVKGQTTIPKAIRDHLGLKAGDKVKYFIRPDGGVTILPVMPAIALAGFLKRKGPTITLDDMDKAIAEGAARAPLPRR